LFANSETLDIVPAASPVFATADRMYANILKALEELYRELKKQTGLIPLRRHRRRVNPKLQRAFEQFNYAPGTAPLP